MEKPEPVNINIEDLLSGSGLGFNIVRKEVQKESIVDEDGKIKEGKIIRRNLDND